MLFFINQNEAIWLAEELFRADQFFASARSETQLPAVKCTCPLWFSRQKPKSESIFKPENICPKRVKNVA
jgi:hypothetical protein